MFGLFVFLQKHLIHFWHISEFNICFSFYESGTFQHFISSFSPIPHPTGFQRHPFSNWKIFPTELIYFLWFFLLLFKEKKTIDLTNIGQTLLLNSWYFPCKEAFFSMFNSPQFLRVFFFHERKQKRLGRKKTSKNSYWPMTLASCLELTHWNPKCILKHVFFCCIPESFRSLITAYSYDDTFLK